MLGVFSFFYQGGGNKGNSCIYLYLSISDLLDVFDDIPHKNMQLGFLWGVGYISVHNDQNLLIGSENVKRNMISYFRYY